MQMKDDASINLPQKGGITFQQTFDSWIKFSRKIKMLKLVQPFGSLDPLYRCASCLSGHLALSSLW